MVKAAPTRRTELESVTSTRSPAACENGVAVSRIDPANGRVTSIVANHDTGRIQGDFPCDGQLARALGTVWDSIGEQEKQHNCTRALVVVWLVGPRSERVLAELVRGVRDEEKAAIRLVILGQKASQVLRLVDGTQYAAVFSDAFAWVVVSELMAHVLAKKDGSEVNSILARVSDRCQNALVERMRQRSKVMDETLGKLEHKLADFQQEMEQTVAACTEPKAQADAVLQIAKSLHAVEAAIVDPNLERLVPVVIQQSPPDSFSNKELWVSLINDSCGRTGKAIRDPEKQKLCTLDADKTKYSPRGYFRLREKHSSAGKPRYRSRALSKISGEVEVVVDSFIDKISSQESPAIRGGGKGGA